MTTCAAFAMTSNGDRWACDTSVPSPLSIQLTKPTRFAVERWLNIVLRSGHAMFETYSVLTRLPLPLRLSAGQAASVLATAFQQDCWLDEAGTRDLRERLAGLDIVGGSSMTPSSVRLPSRITAPCSPATVGPSARTAHSASNTRSWIDAAAARLPLTCRTLRPDFGGMSRRNREKRAAKQKQRRRASAERARTKFDTGPDGLPLQELLVLALRNAAMCREHDAERHATDLLEDFPDSARYLDLAADTVMAGAVRAAWEAGWMPSDLHELARRRLEPSPAEYLAEAIILESKRYAVATLHPRWRADLAAISTGIDPTTQTPQMGRWAELHGVDRGVMLAVVLEVLALLGMLPVLEPLLPLPGACRHSTVEVGDVDEKALGRVRALLAKAEATTFPDEAEALSAKAQELMSRYSLHQAVVDHDLGRASDAAARRIWMDSPYAGAKALLVQAVAMANRCRAVWTENLGFVTVIGSETDLNLVELLTTSLLVQANRAMLAAGRQAGSRGHSRTRSFRQSFLVAYATRIGERLDTTNATVTAEVGDSRLLPVLAAQSRAADDLTDRLFPSMVHRRISVSNGAGWSAGRVAADLALLDVQDSIAG